MDQVKDEKDLLIQIIAQQRDTFLNQLTSAQWQIAKMTPFMPKEPQDDDQRIK